MSASPHRYVATVEKLCALCGQRPEATIHNMPEDTDPCWYPDEDEPRGSPFTSFEDYLSQRTPSFTIPPLTELDGFAYLTEALGRAMRATGEWLVVQANKVERKT